MRKNRTRHALEKFRGHPSLRWGHRDQYGDTRKSLGPTTDQGQLAQYMIEQYYGEGTKNSPNTV